MFAICQSPTGVIHAACAQSIQVVLDAIEVEGVLLGIYPQERVQAQGISITIRLGIHADGLLKRDHIDETADYAQLIAGATEVCRSKHFDLVESLVIALTAWTMAFSPKIRAAQVTVHKLHAPVPAKVSASYALCRGDVHV